MFNMDRISGKWLHTKFFMSPLNEINFPELDRLITVDHPDIMKRSIQIYDNKTALPILDWSRIEEKLAEEIKNEVIICYLLGGYTTPRFETRAIFGEKCILNYSYSHPSIANTPAHCGRFNVSKGKFEKNLIDLLNTKTGLRSVNTNPVLITSMDPYSTCKAQLRIAPFETDKTVRGQVANGRFETFATVSLELENGEIANIVKCAPFFQGESWIEACYLTLLTTKGMVIRKQYKEPFPGIFESDLILVEPDYVSVDMI